MSKKTATFDGFQSCMEAECPGHALKHVCDQQGSVMHSRTQTMHFAGLWANMEPKPSFDVLIGEVSSSVAHRRQASHPSAPLYLLFSHPPRCFLTIFLTPTFLPFSPVFPYLSIPLGLLSISWSIIQGAVFPAQVDSVLSCPIENHKTQLLRKKWQWKSMRTVYKIMNHKK